MNLEKKLFSISLLIDTIPINKVGIVGVSGMSLYEKLPSDFLIQFYYEVQKMISKGLVSKNMYYELGLIIAATSKRGILLDKPKDFKQHIVHELLMELSN
ncbi:hypothetical protein F4694_001286 [Bacillus niacini]|uniref:Uncharacterized protein n=1 Tax=Neobacillus niacini TaxID=86668 RepID=A0A852T6Z1_9BACI|nr:hypothetical protein [Neobacillus niacini]NYE04542.1 hypothetical protein [Neobacillus niacini]